MVGISRVTPDANLFTHYLVVARPSSADKAKSRATVMPMEIICAECGCLVDRGEVIRRCDTQDCCCKDLPDRA